MKLAHPMLDTVFSTEEDRVPTLVIENQVFFRSFLQDISDQIAGFDGKAVLSLNDRVLPFQGNAELVDSFLGFTLNRKPLVNKILSVLERDAVEGARYMDTMAILSSVENLLSELSQFFPCGLSCTKLSIGAIWRAIGIEIAQDYDDPLEMILDYMDLVREFDRDKLFIFVNIRSYFPDEKVELFLETALGHGFQMLLIDSRDYDRLEAEKRVIIDKDLCEF